MTGGVSATASWSLLWNGIVAKRLWDFWIDAAIGTCLRRDPAPDLKSGEAEKREQVPRTI